MLYDVSQVASKLNVSKQSIYNKLKLKEYKNKILIKQGKTYIDDDLLNLIKDNLKIKANLNMNDNIDASEELQDVDSITLDDDLLNLNKDLIDLLKDQLKEKDLQLHEKDIQIHELHKLIENNQVLLREKPQQDIKLLEEHFKDLDNRLLEVRAKMEERKEKSKKNIFHKIFKI